MVYLQAMHLTKSFSEKRLFEDVSFSIHKDQKTAFIAKNGAGKTTLLRIIAGLEVPENGRIIMRNDLNIGYLEQNPVFDNNSSIIDSIFAKAQKVPGIIKTYNEALLSEDKERIAEATDMMDRNDAWRFEEHIKQVLTHLDIIQLNQKMGTLSGGQQKRVALAAVLIGEPEILILDEPTNHLDLEMIVWLEKYLQRSKATLLMVTHDRYFLDRVCNDIIELEGGNVYRYKGNYAYFLEKREQRIDNEKAVIEKAGNIYRKELQWIKRTPMARTAKSKSRVDAFDKIKEQAFAKTFQRQIKLDPKTTRIGKKIMEINYISKTYGPLKLFENFNYVFKKNEKVGIIGKNGCGKSTLLNILAGCDKPDRGDVDVGETVVMGYFRQEGISFKPEQRVIDIAKDIADVVKMSDGSKVSASEFLKQFLFSAEMQYTSVAKLSGGEKRRLYLMTVLMKNPNFLILDEPTNDLDILTLNVLEDYLQNFKGCVVMVSHDRFFMDKIADHIFAFEENGAIKDFPGNYTHYLAYKKRNKPHSTHATEKKQKSERIKKETPKAKKLTFKQQKECEKLESEIQTLEKEKSELEKKLYENNALSHEEILKDTKRLSDILKYIETKSDRWLELSMLYD